MKKLLSILAVALCFVACQNDQSFETAKGDFVTATLNVAAPELDVTRAGSDKDANAGANSAFGAIDFAEGDAEFWSKYDLRYIFEVRSAEENVSVHKETKTFDSYQGTTLEFRAVPNREYNIYAYADFVLQGSEEDLHYNTSDLSKITVDGMNAMDEAYDAYFAAEKFKITTIFNESITLKRFLSKVRVIATDLEWLTDYADPKTVEVDFYNHNLFQSFNLYKGKVETVMAKTTHRYDIKEGYYNLGYDSREDAMTLFTTYLYASTDHTNINFRMSTFDTKDRLIKANDFNTEIPICRNCLTTIVGDVLTTSANITIKIDDNFVEEHVIKGEDGLFDSVPVETLAAPEVKAEVEGNVVTLTWTAVENAAQYGITVGTEMPVFVEETTYTFTGEYETEYTFNVVAIPADEEKFAASDAATVTVTTEAEPVVEFVPVASEWGVVGDLTGWGTKDIVMYTTETEKLFVAKNVEIASGAFKIRANNEWNDAKNYGLKTAGKVYADKYYTVETSGGSQNITPMAYGTYDIYFDLANDRVALVTPGKTYADATNGGDPVQVVDGLKEHSWGLIGSFAGSNWSVDVAMVIEGDWAVAKNVNLVTGNEFKFRADGAWTLSYGSACDVNVDKTYTTYNNGGNMKFTGVAGAYNIYFSMVDAKFYMEKAN